MYNTTIKNLIKHEKLISGIIFLFRSQPCQKLELREFRLYI